MFIESFFELRYMWVALPFSHIHAQISARKNDLCRPPSQKNTTFVSLELRIVLTSSYRKFTKPGCLHMMSLTYGCVPSMSGYSPYGFNRDLASISSGDSRLTFFNCFLDTEKKCLVEVDLLTNCLICSIVLSKQSRMSCPLAASEKSDLNDRSKGDGDS